MRAEILVAGTDIDDPEFCYRVAGLKRRIENLGIETESVIMVRNSVESWSPVLESSLERSGLVVTLGGLGVGEGDCLKRVLARAIGRPLVLNETVLAELEEKFNRLGLDIAGENIKQAFFPDQCSIIRNEFGNEYGFFLKHNEVNVLSLPFKFEQLGDLEKISPLAELVGTETMTRELLVVGSRTKAITAFVRHLTKLYPGVRISCRERLNDQVITISCSGEKKSEVQKKLERIEDLFREKFGDDIYGIGNQTMEEIVGSLLELQHKKISCAESCTGGLISARITDVPGSSSYFSESFITYSNESKTYRLGVPSNLLESRGAVSAETAESMARGLLDTAKSDIALAVTGIAGPGGGTRDKPVGLVYIGLATEETVMVRRYVLSGNRREIKEKAAFVALDLVRRKLLE